MSLNINTKLTNNLNGYLLDGENVKDAIVVYANTSALSNIPSAMLSTGLIAYIKADESFYKYNGETWAKLKSLSGTEIVSVSTTDDYSTVDGYVSNQKYVYFSYDDDITGVQYMLPLVAKILETNTYFIYFSARIKEKFVIASVNSNDDQWNIIEEDQYAKPKESENISIANNGTISDTTALQKIADKQPLYLNGKIAYYSCEVSSVKQYVSIYYDTTNNVTVLMLYKISSNGNTTIVSQDSSTYQEKLTTTSVSAGTIDKVIGFDSNGDIVKATPQSVGMSNPMTTSGDLIIGGSSGTPSRLGIGNNGQVLTITSGSPSWENNIAVDQVYSSSSSNAQSGVAVASAISSALSGVYHFEGTKTVAQLNALTGQTNGSVYNLSDSGVLTSGNVSVTAGDNVAWVSSTSTWDKLASDIDLSSYYTKTETNTLLGNKQNEITSSNKLSADLVDDTNTTNKFVTTSEKSTWNGKQDVIDATHKLSADNVSDTSTTNKFVTTNEKSTWNGKQNALTTTNVSDGTINKAIGFDSSGNVVKQTQSSGSTITFVDWS